MSAVAFTGASRFMFVSLMGAGGSAAAALPPAVLLAARNGLYALSLPQARTRGAPAAAIGGAAIAIVLLPNAPAGLPVMASALAVLPLLLRRGGGT